VVATTGGAHCAPQPEPGLVIHNGQASAPRVTVPLPPLVAAAAARNPGLVPSHFVDMGSGIATGGVIHEPQPAASQAAVRNLERELKNAALSGPGRRTAVQAITQPWSRRQQQNTGILCKILSYFWGCGDTSWFWRV
jgi:hypothetical protein